MTSMEFWDTSEVSGEPCRSPSFIQYDFNMAEPEYDHKWKCFGWDTSHEELGHIPCTSNHEVTARAASHADCAKLVALQNEKDQLIRDQDEFAEVIEKVFKTSSIFEKRLDDVRKPGWNKTSKEYRRVVTEQSGARSDFWLALGSLVTAQRSAATGHVDDQTIELMIRWRATIWDYIVKDNERIGRSYGVEGPMPRGERWVGSWSLGWGSFGTTVCERMI
jgi:hypothetical protein